MAPSVGSGRGSAPIAGGFRLFTIFGITVYLHFTWFLIAAYAIQQRRALYNSVAWNVAEYLTLFAIVLTHEFGHALACRSVGGRADTIMLWPLGGVAYVAPPPRAGALLWSIVAGPLVNVILLPITFPFFALSPDRGLHTYLITIANINLGLLIFNLLPIYPLDGGQIVRALLWFVIGRGRSLLVSAVIGMLGALSLGALALYIQSPWFGVLAIFGGWQAWRGFQSARILRRGESYPRRAGFACPSCGASPPIGPFWNCSNCKRPFDTFERSLICPNCGTAHRVALCPTCRTGSPLAGWMGMRGNVSVGQTQGVGGTASMPMPPLPTLPPLRSGQGGVQGPPPPPLPPL